MSVAAVTDALKAVELTITGVKAAYSLDEIPQRLNVSALPCFINWPGAATYQIAGGLVTETRRYRCILYVDPVQSPAEMRYKGANAEPLLAAARVKLLGAAGLESTASVLAARLVGDTGLVAIEDYGGTYMGVEFTVEVREHVAIAYVD